MSKFKCQMCKEEFENAWSIEDAIKDMKKNFPNLKKKDAILVCAECYQKYAQARDLLREDKTSPTLH